MIVTTRFFHDERCFWHSGGEWSLVLPVGGWVQPGNGGFAESPESNRRLLNLLNVSGLMQKIPSGSAESASEEDLLRVHDPAYLAEFKRLSAGEGGQLGLRTPFLHGGYEIARQSAGLAVAAVDRVLSGDIKNAYALTRPPGHHCLSDTPMGFCLLNNIAIAIEAARARHKVQRVAVIDWDVHHGNGTQGIFWERGDVLALSLHQDRNFPRDGGTPDERGEGPGAGTTINIPLLPGSGGAAYRAAFERIVVPAVERFQPELIIVACGYDASGVDPLSRMLLGAEDFGWMTEAVMDLAESLCAGRLVLVHEGGYSETHVPFCGLAVMEALTGIDTGVGDPLGDRIRAQQPDARHVALQTQMLDEMASGFGFYTSGRKF